MQACELLHLGFTGMLLASNEAIASDIDVQPFEACEDRER
jgi:hypothetical protein